MERLTDQTDQTWHKTACILCECNCGIEVRLGGEGGRRFERIRGNKSHVVSAGYTCEKALRLDHYNNNAGRLTSPLRRRPDGSYEEIDWDTAITEVAAGLASVRDRFGGESIFFYGGGGQGNHLGGVYSSSLLGLLGSRYRSNAIAQEKTGEAYVDSRLYRGHTRGDFDRSEVVVFVGKNPWQSHSFPHARKTLKEIAADEGRASVVIDPRRTESAEMAEYFLQVRPGTDAFCLAALLGIMVEEDLVDHTFLQEHATGVDEVLAALDAIPVADYADRCGVDESLLREVARRLARAESVSVYEDLGVEQAPHSTLVSYLEKLLWILVGSYAKPGGMHLHTGFGAAVITGGGGGGPKKRTTPVTGSPIIAGLIPANVVADEILTDHPKRFRAMIVESSNPANSLADSPRFREAMDALEFSVVVDVAFTETARRAHYVLPASSQFEKPECVFFNFEFPHNAFYLRKPVVDPLPGTRSEPAIHTALVRELGGFDGIDVDGLRAAAAQGRAAFRDAFLAVITERPELGRRGAALLYETLGPTLPAGLEGAAGLWFFAQMTAANYPDAVRRAGHQGEGPDLGDALFDAILDGDDGVIFTDHRYEEAWDLIRHESHKIHAEIPELLDALAALPDAPARYTSDEFPFVLSAGERRSFTANTIIRDPSWRKRDAAGALRINPDDASELGVDDGGRVRIVTRRGQVETIVELTDTLQSGHISLPNGLGLDHPGETGERVTTGVGTNELTSSDHRDEIAGTPWHKHVPARVEVVA